MRPNANRAGHNTLALLCLVLLGMVVASCTLVTGDPGSKVEVFDAEQVEPRDRRFYQDALADLPLRFDTISSVRMANPGAEPVAVREVHLLRDHNNPQRDAIVAVFDDQRFVTVSVRDMTLGMTSHLLKRTYWAPVFAGDFMVFVDEDGVYQEFYRTAVGGGKLKETGTYGLDVRPSTQVAGVGSYVVVPSTDRNTIRGWNAKRQSWQFPDLNSKDATGFRMVQLPPAWDSESIYVVSNNRHLYSIDGQTGEMRFAKDLGRVGGVSTSPVISNDLIFVGNDMGELLAIDRSGKIVTSHNAGVDGPVWGSIYSMDDWVFYRIGKRGYEQIGGDDLSAMNSARTTQAPGNYKINTEPYKWVAAKLDRRKPTTLTERGAAREEGEADEIARDEDGNPIYDVDVVGFDAEAAWTLEDQGNMRVLLKTEKYLYVLYEQWEVPYTERQRNRLKEDGRVVRDEELRVYSKRVLRVLDVETGELVTAGNQAYSWELPSEIVSVIGSQDPTDRAIYFTTRDGYLFKGYADE